MRLQCGALRSSQDVKDSTRLDEATARFDEDCEPPHARHTSPTAGDAAARPAPGDAKVMARALERLLNDACVEELRRGTGGEVGITKVDRDGEIGAPAKHVEKATKGWFQSRASADAPTVL